MMAKQIRFIEGEGRLVAQPGRFLFLTEPHDALEQLILGDPADLTKQVAALAVANDFALPPFVLVRHDDTPSLFIFGDLAVQLGTGEVVDGSQSSTWIERKLDEAEVQAIEMQPPAGDPASLWVVEGSVGASAFAYGTRPSGWPTEANQQRFAPTEQLQTLEEPRPAFSAPLGNGALEDEDLEDEDLEDLDLDGFDPLAERQGVDLEQLGSPNPAELVVAVAPPGNPRAPEPGLTDPGLAEPGLAEPGLAEQELVERPRPGVSTDAPLPPPPAFEIPMPPGYAAPPVPPSPKVEGNDGLNPVVASTMQLDPLQPVDLPDGGGTGYGCLRFDDGQVIDIRQNLYVGRHPTKAGLPPGFDGVVVRGEHVSRVHWELVLDGPLLLIADLRSTSGTCLQVVDGQPVTELQPGVRQRIDPGVRIIFGDRWAIVEA